MTRLLLTPALLFLLAGCASVEPPPAPTATLAGDSARPARASGWLRSELYFGAGAEAKDGQATADAIDDVRWRAFLDAEVTPRFPNGLTVFEAYGQWRYRGEQEPERQRARVLVILHEDSPQHRADIEAIRLAWKRATGHQSVLWSRQPAEVSF